MFKKKREEILNEYVVLCYLTVYVMTICTLLCCTSLNYVMFPPDFVDVSQRLTKFLKLKCVAKPSL